MDSVGSKEAMLELTSTLCARGLKDSIGLRELSLTRSAKVFAL